MLFLRDVFRELCRTRLIYFILAVMIAVGTDMAVRSVQQPAPPEIPPVAAAKTQERPVSIPPLLQEKPKPIVVPKAPTKISTPPIVPSGNGKARLVIIIDDMGVAHAHSRDIIAMNAPLTLSFLPYADSVSTQMQQAVAHGHEVMLHMPMQPIGHEDPGPNAIRPDMAPEQVEAILRNTLDAIPAVKGMNNHMGSAATANRATMDAVMRVLAERKLFFLDSVTTQDSQAQAAAIASNVPYRARDLFLDHTPSQAAVAENLKKMEAVARHKGIAIAIGHPRPDTIAALREWLAGYDRKQFEIVPLSSLFMQATAVPQAVDHTSVPAGAD